MIEGISGRCSTALFPESFSEERCQREVVKAFNTQAVKSLFFKDTQPILDEVMKIRSVMVKELFRSGRTQKQPFDRMMIKVRLDARRGVETLIYKLLQRGTFKSVYVVVCCSERAPRCTHMPRATSFTKIGRISRILKRGWLAMAPGWKR